MAKKRRLQQRVKQIGAQVEAAIRADAEDRKLEHVASDALFQIDRAGGVQTKKQKLQQKDPMVRSKKFDAQKASKHELEAVKKLQQRGAPVQAKPAAKSATAEEAPIWSAAPVAPTPIDEYVAPVVVKKVAQLKRVASTRHKVKKVEVPAAGQSYHPDFEAHQTVLADAVSVEVEREAKMQENLAPIAQGMSEETLQFINSKDSEDEDESDDDDASESVAGASRATKKEKVTKSQRNRRARHKLMVVEHKVRRNEKSIIKQINTSQHILNGIIKTEKASALKQQQKKEMEERKLEEEPLVRVSGKLTKLDRSIPVLLSDELTGSLRTLRPKGNPLLDRFDSLHKRNMIEVNNKRGRSKGKIKIIEVKK